MGKRNSLQKKLSRRATKPRVAILAGIQPMIPLCCLCWNPPKSLETSPRTRNSKDLKRALEEARTSKAELKRIAESRADELEAAHDRLREQIGGRTVKAKAYPPDILGIYVLLPSGATK